MASGERLGQRARAFAGEHRGLLAAAVAVVLVALIAFSRGDGRGGGAGDSPEPTTQPSSGKATGAGHGSKIEAERLAREATGAYDRGDLSKALELFEQAEAADRQVVLGKYKDTYIRLLVEKANLNQNTFPDVALEYRKRAERIQKGS